MVANVIVPARLPVPVRVPPSVRLAQAAFGMSTVTVNPRSIVTASVLVGTLAPAAPPDVADHVLVELQFPFATAQRC